MMSAAAAASSPGCSADGTAGKPAGASGPAGNFAGTGFGTGVRPAAGAKMDAPPPDSPVGSALGRRLLLCPLVVCAGTGRGALPGLPRCGNRSGDEPVAGNPVAVFFAVLDGVPVRIGAGNRRDSASNLEVFENFAGNCKKTLFIRRKMG